MAPGHLRVSGVDVAHGRPRRHVVDNVLEERAGRLVIRAVLEPEKLDLVGHGALSVRRFDRRQADNGRTDNPRCLFGGSRATEGRMRPAAGSQPRRTPTTRLARPDSGKTTLDRPTVFGDDFGYSGSVWKPAPSGSIVGGHPLESNS
jgi:hypothetical protein